MLQIDGKRRVSITVMTEIVVTVEMVAKILKEEEAFVECVNDRHSEVLASK